jgi:cell wall-associated NlpC family hydrolase
VNLNQSSITILLTIFLCLGCTSGRGNIPRPFPRPGGWNSLTKTSITSISTKGIDIATTALNLKGTPYLYGGNSQVGFDCSGFTSYVFSKHGILLPRLASDQYLVGIAIEREELLPGDLVFFETVSPGSSHVGVAIGSDDFIHAPNSNSKVRIERLDSSYWNERYVGGKRIVKNSEE